ncbi:type II toxin-antitoxin system mRNA interferase toxin, RelE/StbE family [Candidatus Roizmanbacteria bacterium CG_4_10_14_0_2_um_filter_33_96]|uniref:Type II toxin-antitoxin system mRNA interferase toxin, RelE/StbE family n=2 Tax=Candidatus Roizmaniibacteriota TaxID=1752723 RepID=A0A2M7U775_9BACT|nr:MAG: type II toxin-antitoxin system mRNA interferase toxin, RelE/StbE family [Candidatus Roizmanbacteria bacterium CG22_combo_CG10-13_8_21_14_all_34_12]PIZ67074.1 MAG: type II toxin-antitoxin system mRNA interferase toxin, RelE/StbE family [Candidatus Roizmanbacteria bacterium CG_4_10_14_0_2_um_filter_33_96]
MKILYQNSFKKSYKKRFFNNKRLINIISLRIQQFNINPNDIQLRTHTLSGAKKGLRSLSVTGDIRIIFYYDQNDNAVFIDIGTHNQVY